MHMTLLLLRYWWTCLRFITGIVWGITKQIGLLTLSVTIENYFPSVGNIPLVFRPWGILQLRGNDFQQSPQRQSLFVYIVFMTMFSWWSGCWWRHWHGKVGSFHGWKSSPSNAGVSGRLCLAEHQRSFTAAWTDHLDCPSYWGHWPN